MMAIPTMMSIPKSKTGKTYKIKRKCAGCGKEFIVKHKLRLYCDKCGGGRPS